MLNQYLKKISTTGYVRRGTRFKFLLSLIVGVMTSLGIAMYLAGSGVSAVTYKTSWIGNTFGGGSKWVQNYIEAMYVAPNGTVYTDSAWDEGGREAGIYKDGNVIGMVADTHGWGRTGGKAVTANSKYIYIGLTQGSIGKTNEDYPPEKITWHCVRRYDLSGKPAPFPEGRGWDKSMLIVSEKSNVTGLATVGSELYVSDPAASQVRVYNNETMKELHNFSVASPGQITVDRQGNLWIIQSKNGSTPAKILHYSKQGNLLPEVITEVESPTAIAVDNKGRLLVAENGRRQQVLIYNITKNPALVGTFGTRSGVYTGVPGEVGDLKLYGLTGVGTDAAGNIYVNSGGFRNLVTDLRKFSPTGALQWRALGLHFVDNADVDPGTDGLEVFTKQGHFLMNYSKPVGQQWTYKAYTINPFKYPQDPRLHTSPNSAFFRRIKGKPFLFLTDMYASFLQIYRFNPATDGKIAIPAGVFTSTHAQEGKSVAESWPPNQPKEGEWIWGDRNGNGAFDQGEYDRLPEDYPYLGGLWVDSNGDIWKALRSPDGIGIRHYPLQGLDAYGNPIYTGKSIIKQKTPSMFIDLRRIEYFPATDTMYVSGFTKEHGEIEDDTGNIGSEIARFDNWSKGNRTPRWRIVVPHDTTGKRDVATESMSVAGDYVFGVTAKTAEVHVYKTATGEEVQKLKPGPEVAGESGWVDIPYGVRAFRRSNGEYLVFVEEDGKAKVIMYQLGAR